MKIIIRGLSAVALLGAGTALAADSGVAIGQLTCRSTDITNVILFTETTFDCTFEGSDGQTDSYTGEVDRIGIDLSIKDNVTMVWQVIAPTDAAGEPKLLRGTYLGASADAAAGVGGGAGVLVGGGGNSFTLQPVTVSGIEGVGVSLGIESFELE
jgi:hypothetical protein